MPTRSLARRVGPALLAASTALVVAPAAGHAQAFVFGTGLDASGAPLPGGALDPHWTFTKAAPTASSGQALVLSPAAYWPGAGDPTVDPGYAPSTPFGRWISSADAAITGLGNVVYRQTFDLSGYVLPTVSITGAIAIADVFEGIYLNGTAITVDQSPEWTARPWTSARGFTIPAGSAALLAGTNVLEIRAAVVNADYNGVMVELTGTGQVVPEPSTWVLSATGLAVLAGVARRRRRG